MARSVQAGVVPSVGTAKLVSFPLREAEPIPLEDLLQVSRELSKLADIERQMERRLHGLMVDYERLSRLKQTAARDRDEMLERLARGAEVC